MPIVLAAPVSSDSPGLSATLPRRMRWVGADGSVWPLTRPYADNPRLMPGVRGLHMPRFEVYESGSPLVPGVELMGYTIAKRPVYWPMLFRSNSIADWEADHAGFFDSFHPVNPGTWIVGEAEKERRLDLTGVFDGSYSFVRDPFVTGRAVIGVELVAPRPLWRGRIVRRVFAAEEGEDFIPTGGAPPFHISPAATFQQATIENTGDEPAYLVWTVQGPADDVQLGVAGAVIEVPFPIPDGSTLVIDTDPSGQFATLNGVDYTRELGFQQFAPVPARGTSALQIAAAGAGVVTAELVPLYWRAF